MFSLAESCSARLALRAALEPASSAAARLRSIWRRKSPFLTLSPSRTARFTTWPCTRADISTLFSAWILPLAVTLETMSWVTTRAVRTGVAWFQLREAAAPAPDTSTPATMIQTRRLRRVNARQATLRPDHRQRASVRASARRRIRVRRERKSDHEESSHPPGGHLSRGIDDAGSFAGPVVQHPEGPDDRAHRAEPVRAVLGRPPQGARRAHRACARPVGGRGVGRAAQGGLPQPIRRRVQDPAPGYEARGTRVHPAVHAGAAGPRRRGQRPSEGGRAAAPVQPDRDRRSEEHTSEL